MVFYFLSAVVAPPMVIYMGADKYENEELLKWGFPEDVWFHVDKLSSAHVYLRLPRGMAIEDIPHEVIVDCAQLVKDNSIEGCKASSVSVVYTPFTNLKKTHEMEVGQVGFHQQRLVQTISLKKNVEIVKRLNKTRKERQPDFRAEREERDRQERAELRRQQLEEKRKLKEEEEQRKREAELRSYNDVMKDENMKSNKLEEGVDYRDLEDDFM